MFKIFVNVVVLTIFLLPLITVGLKIKNLEGCWVLNDYNREYKGLTATVPGGIYTDLFNNKIIDDIFYGNNDVETRWVAKKSWIYTKFFNVEEELLAHEHINIIFEGVDTFSNIFLNSLNIGETDNMFIQYEIDIKKHLKIGVNNITIIFKSPIEEANRLFEIQSRNYTVFPKCVPSKYNGECHVNHIRKMQASFSWDWGPAFPSMGIWKKVYIEAYNNTVIRDISVDIQKGANFWNFGITVYFAKNNANFLEGSIIILITTNQGKLQKVFNINLSGDNKEFIYNRKFTFPLQYFSAWWPNGMGEQKLYPVKITYISPENTEKTSKQFKVGLRSIELVQEPLGSGRSFYFKVNGNPMFAKGSNMIPPHILPEQAQNITLLRYLLQSSKDVHMNMLRVWGGGLYLSNEFYEIADELGILIWQDIMFACSMYPTNREFLSSVDLEVRQQVRRLQYHPSIALWAGNNENEAALRGNWYGTNANFELYKKDYIELYVNTIKKAVLENDNTRPYLVSSPTNGVQSEQEGYVAKNPQSHFYGDVHFYNYIFDGWNANIYPIPRFSSEYGYQSLPSKNSILKATKNISDLDISSTFLSNRQHLPLGYLPMEKLIRDRLPLPGKNSNNFNEAFIFYSQIFQAVAIEVETKYYRQWYNILNDSGEGNTSGALYWQLNDVWMAPTWSGIDFYNNWKMLHYFAKNFFAPIIITHHLLVSRELNIYVVSDEQTFYKAAKLRINVYNWNSFNSLDEEIIPVNVKTGSQIVYTTSIDKYLSRFSQCGNGLVASKNCFLYFTLSWNGKLIAPGSFAVASSFTNSSIQRANVQVSNVRLIKENEFMITLVADFIAAFVWLEIDVPGNFSENGFLMLTNTTELTFYSNIKITADYITKILRVNHLMHTKNL